MENSMPSFGKRSKSRLATTHSLLQEIMSEAIKEYDFSVLCGHRGKEDQNKAFDGGNSKLRFPKSKHNQMPSIAVDIAPYPIDWNDLDRFKAVGKIVKRIAEEKGIDITWGGDWHSFKDYPHFELASTTRNKKEPEEVAYLPDGPTEDDMDDIFKDIEELP